MPSPPLPPPLPEAVAPSSASLVKGYARRGTGQPPFASLLSGLADHASVRERLAGPVAPPARSDPSRRLDAAPAHAPAKQDSAAAADDDSRPTNESTAGSYVGSSQPNAAPRAIASGQSADRSAKDTPAHEGSPVPSAADATGQTAAAAAPSTQGPAVATSIDATGVQAVAAVITLAGGGDVAGAANDASNSDDVTTSGPKPPPPAIAAAARVVAGAPVGRPANAGAVDPGGAAENPVGATAVLSKGGAAAPGQLVEPQLAEPQPAEPQLAETQLAEPQAVDTNQTDITAKSGSGRPAEDGGSTIADRPQAAAATSNPTADAALGIPSASHSTSAAAPTVDRAAAVPLSEIAVTIVAQARSGKSRFDIRLDPPELGRIDVQLSVDRSGNVSTRLIVERPETLDFIRRDAVALERALQDAGLNTGNGMQFSLADQGFASRNGLIDYAVRAPPVAAVDETVAPASAYASAAGRRGGLDITV